MEDGEGGGLAQVGCFPATSIFFGNLGYVQELSSSRLYLVPINLLHRDSRIFQGGGLLKACEFALRNHPVGSGTEHGLGQIIG